MPTCLVFSRAFDKDAMENTDTKVRDRNGLFGEKGILVIIITVEESSMTT
jgi:hypothetical protein